MSEKTELESAREFVETLIAEFEILQNNGASNDTLCAMCQDIEEARRSVRELGGGEI